MILRKPYAFLIKYFRLIHILIFVLFSYLIFAIRPIYVFFADYISGNNNMYFENMASKYIPVALFLVVIVLVMLSTAIYFLMRKKEKPVLFYRLAIIDTVVLFIALIYFYFFFKSLSTTNYSSMRMVINRDIIMILYYTNFLFVAFSFIRAFGFDIKKFSFEKDRKELKLEETDSEEYEVNLNVEKEDVVNYLNRQKREFKYYFAENSTFFIVAGIILFISLALYFSYSHFVTNKIYNEKEDIKINQVVYNIKKSIITTHNKYGEIINEDNDFLVVYITIENKGSKVVFNNQQFRVNVSDKYYYPTEKFCNLFDDLGECYNDTTISGNTTKNYIMIYKLEKKHSKIFMEILNNTKNYEYSKIKLDFKNDNKEIENYNKNDTFIIDDNEYQVKSFELLNKATYIYENCINSKCNKYTKIVNPRLGNKILKIEMTNLEKLSKEILDSYVGLKYRNKVLYGSDIIVVDQYQNNLYLDVPGLVHYEDKLVLTINTRNREYDILLKEGIDE